MKLEIKKIVVLWLVGFLCASAVLVLATNKYFDSTSPTPLVGMVGKVDDRPICFDCLKAPKDREGKFSKLCEKNIMKDLCKNKYNVTWNY